MKIPIEHYQIWLVMEMVIDVEKEEDGTGSKVAGLDHFCLFLYLTKISE